ncbi:MAG: BlaI/MecI/CopY family transcriptional regulator [Planctomycetaceae bacterium]|nr:BlaI/MecI/CopY family transcriptional regulator [Planctomycetaceae bacterium]
MSQSSPRLETLAPRERQVVETVLRLGEASVGDVLAVIPDPPTYSGIRAIMNVLVQKGFLEYRREKTKYLYQAVIEKNSTRAAMLKNLLENFFAGNPSEVVAALLDVAAENLKEKDYRELKQMIENARKENVT